MASAQETTGSLVGSLLVAPETDRKKIVDAYVASRTTDVEDLIAVIATSADRLRESQRIDANSVECHAARLLGKAHAPEAVTTLVRLLAVRDSTFSPVSNQFFPPWRSFPFAMALAEIGIPAVAPLLKQIQASPPSGTEFHVGCVTLEAILGKELATSALKHHAQQFSEFGEVGWLEAATELVETGHVRWMPFTAKDFRLD